MDKKGLKKIYLSKSAAATRRFAQNFAKNLKAGDILALYGSLGAGKTTFIQGLAAGLGYSGRVVSPTFILVRPYKIENREQRTANSKSNIKTLYHIDLYRIEGSLNLKTIGFEEFLADEEGICAIEWAEKCEKFLPSDKTIKIRLMAAGKSARQINISCAK